MKADPEMQIMPPLTPPEERYLWCEPQNQNPFPSKTPASTAELGKVICVRNSG